MNPYGAMAWQSIGLAAAVLDTWLFGPDRFDLALAYLLSLLAIMGLVLSILYARNLSRDSAAPRDRWRRNGDLLAIGEVAAPVALAWSLTIVSSPIKHLPGGLELATASLLLGVMLGVVLGSSLWDWWYVLPNRDGLIRLPPCMSSGDPKWKRVTETWLRHRLIAETTFVLFFPVTAAIITAEIWTSEPSSVQWVSKVVGIAATLIGVAFSASKLRLAVGIRSITDGPSFSIGDTLRWSVNPNDPWVQKRTKTVTFRSWQLAASISENPSGRKQQTIRSNGKGSYVLDVSLERATLLRMKESNGVHHVRETLQASMRALTSEDATKAEAISYCGAGRCLGLNDRCARATPSL